MDIVFSKLEEWSSKVCLTPFVICSYPFDYWIGTYCQERELEEINRADFSEGDSRQCGAINFPSFLGIKDMFVTRWNSWEVLNTGEFEI
jgi:hypothetical protein